MGGVVSFLLSRHSSINVAQMNANLGQGLYSFISKGDWSARLALVGWLLGNIITVVHHVSSSLLLIASVT